MFPSTLASVVVLIPLLTRELYFPFCRAFVVLGRALVHAEVRLLDVLDPQSGLVVQEGRGQPGLGVRRRALAVRSVLPLNLCAAKIVKKL